jgi:hypothetical protein
VVWRVVLMYKRFRSNPRDVKDLLFERGIAISAKQIAPTIGGSVGALYRHLLRTKFDHV